MFVKDHVFDLYGNKIILILFNILLSKVSERGLEEGPGCTLPFLWKKCVGLGLFQIKS